MRKIEKRDVLKLVLVLALIAGIGFAMGTVGRFVPTHKIVEPVYCGSCHPEQVGELASTTHLGSFAANAQTMANRPKNAASEAAGDPFAEGNAGYGRPALGKLMSDAEAISAGCTMCHNYWENFKWFGVVNFTLEQDQIDNPDPVTDIYGNTVSPYGLGSTKAFIAKMNATDNAIVGIEPWAYGIDNWQYTDPVTDQVHTRLDYVWSALSSKSPGPVAFQVYKNPGITIYGAGGDDGKLVKARGGTRYVSCGSAEKGMCHIAENAVAMAAGEKKLEYPNQSSLRDSVGGAQEGAGVFFTHEMAYTTAQYAAKPVKICGACHMLKLPPMKWGGEPWAGDEIRAASTGVPYAEKAYIGQNDPTKGNYGYAGPEHKIVIDNTEGVRDSIMGYTGDPFTPDLTPTYDQSGKISWTRDGTASMDVTYKTPDWAHQIVPCIRCHTHAGINGESVSDNT